MQPTQSDLQRRDESTQPSSATASASSEALKSSEKAPSDLSLQLGEQVQHQASGQDFKHVGSGLVQRQSQSPSQADEQEIALGLTKLASNTLPVAHPGAHLTRLSTQVFSPKNNPFTDPSSSCFCPFLHGQAPFAPYALHGANAKGGLGSLPSQAVPAFFLAPGRKHGFRGISEDTRGGHSKWRPQLSIRLDAQGRAGPHFPIAKWSNLPHCDTPAMAAAVRDIADIWKAHCYGQDSGTVQQYNLPFQVYRAEMLDRIKACRTAGDVRALCLQSRDDGTLAALAQQAQRLEELPAGQQASPQQAVRRGPEEGGSLAPEGEEPARQLKRARSERGGEGRDPADRCPAVGGHQALLLRSTPADTKQTPEGGTQEGAGPREWWTGLVNATGALTRAQRAKHAQQDTPEQQRRQGRQSEGGAVINTVHGQCGLREAAPSVDPHLLPLAQSLLAAVAALAPAAAPPLADAAAAAAVAAAQADEMAGLLLQHCRTSGLSSEATARRDGARPVLGLHHRGLHQGRGGGGGSRGREAAAASGEGHVPPPAAPVQPSGPSRQSPLELGRGADGAAASAANHAGGDALGGAAHSGAAAVPGAASIGNGECMPAEQGQDAELERSGAARGNAALYDGEGLVRRGEEDGADPCQVAQYLAMFPGLTLEERGMHLAIAKRLSGPGHSPQQLAHWLGRILAQREAAGR